MKECIRLLICVCAVFALGEAVRACILGSCEKSCKVIRLFHVDGDGFKYAGNVATHVDHRAPSAGGNPKSKRIVSATLYDFMCRRCATCANNVCEGQNPSVVITTTRAKMPVACVRIRDLPLAGRSSTEAGQVVASSLGLARYTVSSLAVVDYLLSNGQ